MLMKALDKDAIIITVCKMGSLFVFGFASEESDILLFRILGITKNGSFV